MKKIKVCNLYPGIGGNRKLWPNDKIEVTAVEINKDIAKIYQDFFPMDKIIVGDAHEYLLKHYMEYDLIWSSIPCVTHSKMRTIFNNCDGPGRRDVVYLDMKLYQEIILLKHYCKKLWCVENVKPYYTPLINPQYVGRHAFWCNFYISRFKEIRSFGICDEKNINIIKALQKQYNISLKKYKGIDKRKTLRNCVDPKLGLHIFNCAFRQQQLQFNME